MARGTNKILHQMFLKMIKQNGEMMFINFANICVENIPSSFNIFVEVKYRIGKCLILV